MTSDSLNFIEGPTKLLALKMVSILYRTVVTRETERERERENGVESRWSCGIPVAQRNVISHIDSEIPPDFLRRSLD